MSITNFNRYIITITSENYQCIYVNDKPTTHFIYPDTKHNLQKLYLLKNDKEIYYVGVTSQPMSTRFRLGFQESSPNGYHGYKWRHQIKQAELLIWCFSNNDKSFSESIEGELVYFIRNRAGSWPIYQMEIHFHPDATDEEKNIAEMIFKDCMEYNAK